MKEFLHQSIYHVISFVEVLEESKLICSGKKNQNSGCSQEGGSADNWERALKVLCG